MPPPRIIQVEVTTACQLRCSFCPHTVLADDWITANLPWETFSPLLPSLRSAELVHLQGWGEPLLHPRIWDMAAAIKERRGRVSLTTNAMLLDKTACHKASQIGIDLVAISVAGAQAATNDSLRVGSDFNQICANISYLCQLEPRPKVTLVMQMMKPNIEELPELVALAARLGVDEVVAPNLDYIPAVEIENLIAFASSPDPHYTELVDKAHSQGEELGVKVHTYPLTPSNSVSVCDADPLHNICITASGEIVPCVYVALLCRQNIPRVFWGKAETFPRFSFGGVAEGLDQVLNGQTAHSFRECFTRRQSAGRLDTMSAVALSAMPRVRCTSSAFLEPVAGTAPTRRHTSLPPPPELCRNCYKLYGL